MADSNSMNVSTSPSGLEVCVGRNAADNARLTNDADKDDIWMHDASGPGPHVVIEGPAPGQADMLYAASLALRGRPGMVTVCRCADVSSNHRGTATTHNAWSLRVEHSRRCS